MQRAMLSSVGLWAASFAESLLDDRALLRAVYGIVDQSPLGSAASYGVPLPIDRQYTADLLGFPGHLTATGPTQPAAAADRSVADGNTRPACRHQTRPGPAWLNAKSRPPPSGAA